MVHRDDFDAAVERASLLEHRSHSKSINKHYKENKTGKRRTLGAMESSTGRRERRPPRNYEMRQLGQIRARNESIITKNDFNNEHDQREGEMLTS